MPCAAPAQEKPVDAAIDAAGGTVEVPSDAPVDVPDATVDAQKNPPDVTAPEIAAPVIGGWMTRGGETLPMGTHAVEIKGGIPSAGVQFDVPVTPFMEVNTHLSYHYAMAGNFLLTDKMTLSNSLTIGVQMKFNVVKSGHHAMSLAIDTAFIGEFGDRGGIYPLVTVMGLDARYSYRWDKPRIAVITGFRCPPYFAEGAMGAPMFFMLGFEYNVARRLNIHLIAESGVMLTIGDDEDEENLWPLLGVEAGVSILW